MPPETRNLRGTSEEPQGNLRGTSGEPQRNLRGTSGEPQRNLRGTTGEPQRNLRGTSEGRQAKLSSEDKVWPTKSSAQDLWRKKVLQHFISDTNKSEMFSLYRFFSCVKQTPNIKSRGFFFSFKSFLSTRVSHTRRKISGTAFWLFFFPTHENYLFWNCFFLLKFLPHPPTDEKSFCLFFPPKTFSSSKCFVHSSFACEFLFHTWKN